MSVADLLAVLFPQFALLSMDFVVGYRSQEKPTEAWSLPTPLAPSAGPSAPTSEYTVFPPGPLRGFIKCPAIGTGDDLSVARARANRTTVGVVADVNVADDTINLPALAGRARPTRSAPTTPDRS